MTSDRWGVFSALMMAGLLLLVGCSDSSEATEDQLDNVEAGPAETAPSGESAAGSDDETDGAAEGGGRVGVIGPELFVAPTDGVGAGPADFGTIAQAIAWADPGDEVILRPGVHVISGEVVFDKQIILRSEVPGAAVITTSLEAPTSQRSDSLPVGYLVLRDEVADGSQVLDIAFRNIGHSFTGQAIYVERVRDVLIKGNTFQHTGARAVIVFDTEDVRVTENQFLNPYLPDDEPNRIEARLEGRTTSESYMDYGVMVYGSIRPMVDHNYFFGIFHQALSFKEGSVDASAIANTFEGFAFTGLFIGQNNPGGNSFERFGPPDSAPERGTITVAENVFRGVADEAGEYLPGIALRLSYFDADVTLDSNIVESAFIPLQVDCNDGGAPSCANGSLTITNSVFNGTVIDQEGGGHRFEKSACIQMRDIDGADLTVELESNTILGCGLAHELLGLDFTFVSQIVADMVSAPDGSPTSVAGNLTWEAPGDFGADATEADPAFAQTPGPVSDPEATLEGASAAPPFFGPSAESPPLFTQGTVGAG